MPKILLDMDIGDDIDDAFALLLAMRMQYDIVGITTVFRNTPERARITKKLLSDFGRGYENIPVLAGFGTPLAESAPADGYPRLCQYSPDIDRFTPDSLNPDDAVDFIISACEKYGKDLTVVAIGPFTNMAKVAEKDPTALGKAAAVAVMAGAFYKQYADWNVMCDPEAARIFFENTPNIIAFGADVTHQLDIGEENSRRILDYAGDDPAASYAAELYRLWCRATGGRAKLHDPLVILAAAEPDVCRMEKISVRVLTEGPARGLTLNVNAYHKAYLNPFYNTAPEPPAVTAAAAVDRERVIGRFMEECF